MEASRKLLSPEREELILSELGGGASSVAFLCRALAVSEATVRRDLLSLERQGKVKRVHGGAVKVKFPGDEPVFEEKKSSHAGEKDLIAEAALALVEDRDIIYLDGGSTVLALARLLHRKKNLTIVTNSLMAAAELMESGHSIIIAGGRFRPLSRTLVGPLTAKIINSLHFNKAFMGTIGFTVESGISTTDPDEAYTKELIIRNSDTVILLADKTKIGIESFAASGNPDDIDFLVTDAEITANFAKELKKKSIRSICVK